MNMPWKRIKSCALLSLAPAMLFILAGCVDFSPKIGGSENSSTPAHSKPECHVNNNISGIVTTTYREPQNVDLLRQEIKAWYNSGGYSQAMAQVGDMAMDYLKKNQNTPGKLALVMDVDETALSNYKMEIQKNFYVDGEMLDKWQRESNATVIEPTLKLFQQAQKQNIATIFLTGRKEVYRAATEENLRKAGYQNWTKLIMKPDDSKTPTSEFKTSERKKLEDSGTRIIINLGDQYSDMGAYADRNFKYPDPFYYL